MEKLDYAKIGSEFKRGCQVFEKINELIDENENLTKRLNALFDLYAGVETENQKLREAVKYLAKFSISGTYGIDKINKILGE